MARGCRAQQAWYKTVVFLIGETDKLGKGYTVIESFADHRPVLVPLSSFTALGRIGKVAHMSPKGLLRLVLSTTGCEEAQKADELRNFLNAIINRGSEGEDRRLRQCGFRQYYMTI